MDSNSPGKPPAAQVAGQMSRDERAKSGDDGGRRARSRSRTRSGLSSRVTFFEQVWRGRNRSPSVEKTPADSASGQSNELNVDKLEKQIEERRRRLTVSPDVVPTHQLRHVASPVRDASKSSKSSEVMVAAWTERVRSPVRDLSQSVAGSPAREVDDPPAGDLSPTKSPVDEVPWRMKRTCSTQSDPANSATDGDSSAVEGRVRASEFGTVPPPSSSLSKYQESKRRSKRPTNDPSRTSCSGPNSGASVDQESGIRQPPDGPPADDLIVPWRKRTAVESKRGHATTRTTPDESKEAAPRRASDHSQPTGGDRWGGVLRKSSQPEWYSEYRTSTLSQTASRLEQLRGHITSHYDFHIAEIKGEKCTATGSVPLMS